MSWLVVGAGFTGATVAERLASAGEEVLVVERRSRIGGSAEDYRADDGLLIQKYGPHVFHTNSERVWQYVQRFGEWRPIKYRVAASVRGALVPLPLDFRAVRACFETFAETNIERMTAEYGLGARVTLPQLRKSSPTFAEWAIDHVFRGYNEKHWGMPLEDVPQSVIARLPFVVGEQDSYFTDKYQALPKDGYTAVIERMLDHPKIHLVLNYDVEDLQEFQRAVWTGSPDDFFGEAGALPYRSVHFRSERRGLHAAIAPYVTVTNPEHDGPTRTTDMHLMQGAADRGPDNIRVYDHPCAYVPGKNDPFYPIPLESNIRLAQEYAARRPKNVWFAGRLGSYSYLNMDQAIAQALALVVRIQ